MPGAVIAVPGDWRGPELACGTGATPGPRGRMAAGGGAAGAPGAVAGGYGVCAGAAGGGGVAPAGGFASSAAGTRTACCGPRGRRTDSNPSPLGAAGAGPACTAGSIPVGSGG